MSAVTHTHTHTHTHTQKKKKKKKKKKQHTCDEVEMEIREIFLSFQGDFYKMYRIYRKILCSFQEKLKNVFVKN